MKAFLKHLNRDLISISKQRYTFGSTTMISRKFTVMTIPEKMPKEQIGMIGLKHVARKETAVVIEVTSIALEALRKA